MKTSPNTEHGCVNVHPGIGNPIRIPLFGFGHAIRNSAQDAGIKDPARQEISLQMKHIPVNTFGRKRATPSVYKSVGGGLHGDLASGSSLCLPSTGPRA
jgi:hypothetical protein